MATITKRPISLPEGETARTGKAVFFNDVLVAIVVEAGGTSQRVIASFGCASNPDQTIFADEQALDQWLREVRSRPER